MTLKLVSLNMELDRHLGDQKRFLDREAPDIICLQEVHEVEFDALRAEHGHGVFAPMCLTRRLDGRFARQGVCIVSRHALRDPQIRPYRDPGGPLVEFEAHRMPQSLIRRVLVMAGVQQRDGRAPMIGTTHFTWSPDGKANPEQLRDVDLLLAHLEGHEPVVFCGDFNAPRGGEIFARVAAHYTDHVPARCTTSIDGARHRAGALQLMVDGLFSSPGVTAADVRLVDGVSDHMAIVADITVD
jgi:endonuclease/exonuclease/phosphatase family metal-dependent hydrolase